MNVKLISVSNPKIEGIESAEDLVAFCARVSNPSNQMNIETAPKLLRYLIANKHWSPFEMISMTVEIKTSRAIAAQILRHRSFSFQEFSQRYSKATEICDVELREQAQKNRQSSTDVFNPVLPNWIHGEIEKGANANIAIEYANEMCQELYKSLIEAGVAKECARMILPLATETTMYMSGTIRSWIHYLDLRCDDHTQKEHRDIATAIKEIFTQQFPTIAEALQWHINSENSILSRPCPECGLDPCKKELSHNQKQNATGTEADVIEDIRRRQEFGRSKYGTTVRDNQLTHKEWLQHAYEEALDMAIYLKRSMEE